jgi:hypothetical protein
MNDILRRYIIEVISEVKTVLDSEGTEPEEDDVNEFSGVGAIAGFTAPLGWSGKDIEGPKVKERKKRKNPTWK